MSRQMKLLSGAQYMGLGTFPESPQPGQTAFVEGLLYIYAQVGGIETWYPLNQPQTAYVHSQGGANTKWVINHELGTQDVIVGVYDDQNRVMDADVQSLQDAESGDWRVEVTLAEAMTGHAVVFAKEHLGGSGIDARYINVSEDIKVGGSSVVTEGDLLDLGLL